MRETDERERLELALIENMAREDLNPVEEARACATLVDDLGLTKEELGRRVGRSRVGGLEPDPPARAARRGAGADRARRAVRGPRPRAADVRRTSDDAGAARARGARGGAGRCARPSARARGRAPRVAPRQPARGGTSIHPDLDEALAAAEDALSAALGREVRSRPRAGRYRVEFELEHPREGVDLAERILRRAAALKRAAAVPGALAHRPLESAAARAISSVG